ncbi:hypothetical protein DL96DRAFT_1443917, partial [Flagelloscypha sp. PMI_526]
SGSEEAHGCAFLQAICSQMANYTTTQGEYLESIFVHRELYNAVPQSHKGCSARYRELAQCLETRVWRCDREGDAEAASAFRYEA